ncbi:MAG: hypothetical protein ACLUS6_00820 [Dysosmobacter sp.]
MFRRDESDEDDEESGKTATFPFLNRLFSNGSNPPAEQQPSQNGGAGQHGTGRKTEKSANSWITTAST